MLIATQPGAAPATSGHAKLLRRVLVAFLRALDDLVPNYQLRHFWGYLEKYEQITENPSSNPFFSGKGNIYTR